METEKTQRRHVSQCIVALAVGASAAFAACESSVQIGPGFSEDAGPALVFPTSDAAVDGPAACELSCSADLHKVVDCKGTVLETCAPNTGCAPGGKCVAPCDSSNANKSTLGCEFWVQPPATAIPLDGVSANSGSCFAAIVVNAWTTPVALELEFEGKKLPLTGAARLLRADASLAPLPDGKVPAGAIAAIFLHRRVPSGDILVGADGRQRFDFENVACPTGVVPAVTGRDISTLDPASQSLRAFHIVSDLPMSAYTLYPYGGAQAAITSGSLLLPTSAWGTNYMMAAGYERSAGLPFTQIVAQEDNTKITISPKAVLRGAPATDAGAPAIVGADVRNPGTYLLSRGQILQFVQPQLSGGIVESDKPIALWAGDRCTSVGSPYCDSLHQQLPPISQIGSEYVAVPYTPRGGVDESGKPTTVDVTPWRLIAAVDGTTVTFDPPIGAAPLGTLGLDATDVAPFVEAEPFVMRSQDKAHPFYASGYMSGGGDHVLNPETNPYGAGDADFYNLIPTQQFMSEYRFFTDPTFRTAELLLVRKGKTVVNIDCLGAPVDGWAQVGKSEYEFARVFLLKNGVPTGSCKNGVQRAFASEPFGLIVSGQDSYVSYMFPAGMRSNVLSSVRVPAVPR